jgi:hypothetical protein
MKVTAILPDKLVKEVRQLTRGKNLTESLIIALHEWTNLRHVRELNSQVAKKPLEFVKDFSAEQIRNINRKV